MSSSSAKKARRMIERMEEKARRKAQRPTPKEDNKPTHNEVLGLTSIAEMQKMGFGAMYRQKVKDAWRLDWYFSGWEKLVIMGSFFWTVYCIGKWVWGFI